jgi:O-antigen ligase
MSKLVSHERPVWFYMFFALGLFVTLNTYIGARGHGNAQIPFVFYLIILASIIAKYHVFRWRSPSVAVLSMLILYGAAGSFVARVSGEELSFFTGMALGVIVITLHFLPKNVLIDLCLVKKFLYFSGLLFVVSRIGLLLVSDYVEVTYPVLFLTHEVAFLLPFVFLIPLFDKKNMSALMGLMLSTLFLVVDFRTTTLIIYVFIIISAIVFMIQPFRISLKNINRTLLLLFSVLAIFVITLTGDLVQKVAEIDLYFRDLLGRPNTQTFRQNLNELALEKIAAKPFLGEIFQGSSISLEHLYFGAWRTDPVHNVFLAMGAQGGLVFLILLVSILLFLLITATRVSARSWASQPEGAKVLATLVVSLASAVVSGMVNPFLSYAMGAFWFWTIIMLLFLVKDTLTARERDGRVQELEGPLCSQPRAWEHSR